MHSASPSLLLLVILSFSGVAAQAADPILLELSAGAVARRETPIRFALPADMKPEGPWKLLRDGDGKSVPFQLDELGPPALVWVLEEELPAGKKRRYRLEPGAPGPSPARVECKEVGGKHLLFTSGEKSILRYNHGLVEPPEGVQPIFARSGYIHPVWTPSGRVITNDAPANHRHHHGIWMPWTKTLFEGRPVNFWEQAEGLGKVEATGVDEKLSGPVFGGFRARHRFLELKAPGGPKPVLDEVWDVKVYALDRVFLVDFVSVQKCAGESPLVLKEYRYGGFGFRGSGEWEGEKGAEFITSEGKT
ncbi:MAG TPA: DUF6807 family protein, partial [Planctomycetota bacterium]|nr:DUF6807 family protein [Planctomycetota bacterium]